MGNLLGIWVALAVVAGLVVGVVAGAVAWIGGQSPATAVLIGGGAFTATVTLALLIINTFLK